MKHTKRSGETPSLAINLAEESSERACEKEHFNARIQRYGNAKRTTEPVIDYIRNNEPDYLKIVYRMDDCGSYLLFRNYYTEGEIRLRAAKFCKKHLLCTLCAIRRGAKLVSRYKDRFDRIVAERPDLKPYMVTLTVKDGDNLTERFKHLQKSLITWHKRRHRKNAACEARKAEGAAWSYEIKRGKRSGLWHPHVHCIWLCESPPDQTAISEEWHAITGDSYIVDVRPINPTDPTTGFLEVFKYAVKFSEQPPEDTWHGFLSLTGKRLIGSFGNLYGIPEPNDLLDDPLEGKPYFEMMYLYLGSNGYRMIEIEPEEQKNYA